MEDPRNCSMLIPQNLAVLKEKKEDFAEKLEGETVIAGKG